jgi:hypothetical protein
MKKKKCHKGVPKIPDTWASISQSHPVILKEAKYTRMSYLKGLC